MEKPQTPSFFDDPDTDSWGLVIKVTHGDSLKRFGASVCQKSMDLDMMNLRTKIVSLFNLKLDAELVLTYVDEDGDAVALDTDDELHDAIVIQRLNPLRINAQYLHNANQECSLGTVSSKSTTTCPQQAEKSCNWSPFKSLWKSMGPAEETSFPDQKLDKVTTSKVNVPKHINPAKQHKDTCEQFILGPSGLPPYHFDHLSNLFQPKHINPAAHKKHFPRGSFPTRHLDKRTGIHIGVVCDGCEMFPIVGTRMKSKVKENYDLCSLCFLEMGCESDYTKIESTEFATSSQLRKFYDSLSHSKHELTRHGILSRKKFDSCFIKDVTISDGMLVAPSTTFTKMWRMCNNGTSGWPYGTHLVWISGDKFSSHNSFMLDIPQEGYPAGEEIDVTVDLTSPSSVGSYVSYWRLALPSGHMFGHRVWVHIQVVEVSQPDCYTENLRLDIDLNVTDVDVSLIDDLNLQSERNIQHESTLTVLVEDSGPDKSEELTRDAHPATGNATPKIMPPASSVSVPTLDATGDAAPEIMSPPSVSVPTLDLPSSLQNDTVNNVLPTESVEVGDDSVEQTLRKELEDMGFKRIDLNKEDLMLDDDNLKKSSFDIGFEEWDMLLSELQDLGFDDKEKNKTLLVKNGGSISRVVKDLIAEETA